VHIFQQQSVDTGVAQQLGFLSRSDHNVFKVLMRIWCAWQGSHVHHAHNRVIRAKE
jgi:hypothetical protein